MHVITFYSFKGGVGRTLAMVNVAAQLASEGRRVLLVDFDLEAPGIDTFNLPRPENATPGIVDYVADYIETGKAPPVERYIYKAPKVGSGDGQLWVMPAGTVDDTYGPRFNDINWAGLYAQHSGYMLFENLKKQWEDLLQPDYVFIDSRTGHTDVGGICTRQLPDAVVLLFFPNEQNLRGITTVVSDIREESQRRRQKTIRLHFVMSNVPQLDDEDSILENFVSRCRQELDLDDEPAIIHHYPSLDLLTQNIFTLKHPNSRLSKQYGVLADAIKRQNPDDPDGAISYLERSLRDLRRSRRGVRAVDLVETLQTIRRKHSANGRVLLRVAKVWQHLGKLDEAGSVYDQAEAAGLAVPRLWMAQAEARAELGDTQGAALAAQKILKSPDSNEYQVGFALRLLARFDPSAIPRPGQMPALRSLDPQGRFWVAQDLSDSAAGVARGRDILQELLASGDVDEKLRDRVQERIAHNNLALGKASDAIAALGPPRPLESKDIARVFNYAMAEWALNGSPPRDLFEHALELNARNSPRPYDANFLQCLAIAAWAVQRQEDALKFLARSRQQIVHTMSPEFTCWRYMTVSANEFLEDLDEIEQLLSGQPVLPRFMRSQDPASTGD